jgi:DNA primase
MGQDLSEKNVIAERTSILDLVSPHVALKQAGRYYRGLCPFHPDKNPSFVVNPERNTFYCFGCGAGGDIYSFFMKFNNLSFPQALEELARRAGVPLREGPRRKDPEKEEADRRALALNEAVCRFYHRTLLEAPEAGAAREYLHKRGIGGETIRAFSLGYATAGWDRLLRFLQKRQGAAELASTLGLVIPRKGGSGSYDRFRNRLMFPIFNTLGQVLAFGGRALGDEEPKYMNSPESFLYHKGSVLYGLHRAQPSIRERDAVIVVEGYFDLLSLHQNGLQNAVAVLGTALTTGQIDILKRHTQNLVLVFDGDPAGKKASFRNLPDLVQRGLPVRVVYLPENEDPDSFLNKWGADAFRELLDRAPSLLETFLRERTDGIGKGDPVEKKVAALREVLPVIGSIPDRLAQGLRIRALAEATGVPELSVREELSKIRGGRQRSQEKVPQHSGQWPAEERLICQILMQFPSLLPRFIEAGVLESFKSAALGETIRACVEQFRDKGSLNLSEVLPHEADDPALFRLLSRLSCKEEFTEEQASTALDDSVRRLRTRALKERLDALHARIREADQSRQDDLMRQLSREMQRLLDEKKALLC